MREKDIVRMAMKERGETQEGLGKKVGFKSPSHVTGILNRYNSMRVDVLMKLLEAMDYGVVVIDKRTGRKFQEITLPTERSVQTEVLKPYEYK